MAYGPGLRGGVKWTDAQLIEAVRECTSVFQVTKRLGLKSPSGAARTIRAHAKRLGISMDHFVGRKASGNRTKGRANQLPLDQVLVEDSPIHRAYHLKNRLLAAGLLTWRCYECGICEWNGKPLALQLDHINGNNRDNRLSNLRILCPNCHSQTETYAGRNNRKKV